MDYKYFVDFGRKRCFLIIFSNNWNQKFKMAATCDVIYVTMVVTETS